MHWPMLPKGTDFHLPSHTERFLISGYHPPCWRPTSSAMSDTSSRPSRYSHSCWTQAASTGALLCTIATVPGTPDPPAPNNRSEPFAPPHPAEPWWRCGSLGRCARGFARRGAVSSGFRPAARRTPGRAEGPSGGDALGSGEERAGGRVQHARPAHLLVEQRDDRADAVAELLADRDEVLVLHADPVPHELRHVAAERLAVGHHVHDHAADRDAELVEPA